jgi:hypothetical protein
MAETVYGMSKHVKDNTTKQTHAHVHPEPQISQSEFKQWIAASARSSESMQRLQPSRYPQNLA